jgi:hypothetical protein
VQVPREVTQARREARKDCVVETTAGTGTDTFYDSRAPILLRVCGTAATQPAHLSVQALCAVEVVRRRQ